MKRRKILLPILIIIYYANYNSALGQVTGVGTAIAASDILGTSNSNDANIVTQQSQNINFFTNSGTTYPWSNQRMTILSTGEIGIGNFTPTHKLEIDGDLNLRFASQIFRLAGSEFLWNNGNPANLFVGIDAGNNSSNQDDNTLIGYKCGNLLTDPGAKWNTFVGSEAGAGNIIFSTGTKGWNNTGVGYKALMSTDAYGGCAFGYNAAVNNTYGCSITAVGEDALAGNSIGNDNCAFGHHALLFNTELGGNVALGSDALQYQNYTPSLHGNTCPGTDPKGCVNSYNVAVGNSALENTSPNSINTSTHVLTSGMNNTAIGTSAGSVNTIGYNNLFAGFGANAGANNLNNASAIGNSALVMHTNEMILGNNDVKVGIGLSGNSIGPRDKLEISSGTTGTSGLQFRNLVSTFTPSTSATKFLTVDIDGKVILSNEGIAGAYNGTTLNSGTSKVQLGQDIGGSGATLISNREIPMREFDIYFTEPSTIGSNYGNNILMGIPTSYTPTANDPRLNVVKSTSISPYINFSVAGNFVSNVPYDDGSAVGYAVSGVTNQASSDAITCSLIAGGYFEGISGQVRNGTAGVIGKAHSDFASSTTWGGVFSANVFPNMGSGNAIGVAGDAYGANMNIGVFGTVPCSSCSDWAGYFNGDVFSTTGVYASDSILKSNVSNIENVTDQLRLLHPYSYMFDHSVYPQLNLSTKLNFGLFSQEVERVFPNLVQDVPIIPETDSMGNVIHPGGTIKGLNYIGLIPLLLKGIQEQQNKIDSLTNRDSLNTARLNDLEQKINNCCNNGGHLRSSNPAIDVELTNSIILNNADPNPFAEETVITFNIPGSVSDAKIIFFDNLGHIIQTVKINERGSGQLNVYASNLTSGLYSYSLIADGKVVDTKKMVVMK
jgi:hypothetical protein